MSRSHTDSFLLVKSTEANVRGHIEMVRAAALRGDPDDVQAAQDVAMAAFQALLDAICSNAEVVRRIAGGA